MRRKVLKNKPLVEAIFELQWALQEPAPDMKIDPHYKLLIGRLYDKLGKEYPFHEQLPTAAIPDEIAGYLVQHRFRKSENKWPLVQIGPGIITVNDTEGYVWEDFEKKVIKAVNILFEVYPESKNKLKVNKVTLRYIDAIKFDFEKNDIFTFLKKQVKTEVSLYQRLFQGKRVNKLPLGLDLRFAFASAEPKGIINLRFARGGRKRADALIWETMIGSASDDAPKVQEEIADWLKKAHNLTDDWFFKLIEGELLRRFE
jgi:uncharacterized protein (TIGR04255 family)